MAGGVATNIRVRIDLKDAMGRITQLQQGMGAVGTAGVKAGSQVAQGMQQASGAMKNAGQTAASTAVNFQTMGQGMLNLSTSAVQTYTSISNLARAENRAAASAVGLERANDLLARKEEQLKKIIEAGNGAGRDAILIRKEIATATQDLAVKTDKLKIEQEAVTDVYLLFFANLANVGVSTMMIYKTMMEGQTKATVWNSIVKGKNTIVTKFNSLAQWNSSKSFLASSVASKTATGGLVAQTLATRIATVATKGLTMALGPIGLIIIGISAAMLAYETNFKGFRDGVNSFLGIQDDFNEGLGETKDGMDELGESTDNLGGKVDKLPETWKQARTAMNRYRDDLLSVRNAQNLAADATERLNGNIAISLSGFNGTSGPKTEEKKKGLFGILESLSKLEFKGNQAYAEEFQPQLPRTVIEVQLDLGIVPKAKFSMVGGLPIVSGIENEELTTLFEDARLRESVGEYRGYEYNLAKKVKEDKARVDKLTKFGVYSMIGTDIIYGRDPDEFDVFRGGEYLISNESDSKLSKILGKDISIYEANRIYKRAQAGDSTLTKKERDVAKAFSMDLGLLNKDQGKDESKRLMTLDNRDFIKQALFVDIGAVANVIPRTEALRLAVMQKTMTKQFTNTTGGKTAGVARTLAENGGIPKEMLSLMQTYSRQDQDVMYNKMLGNGTISATQAYQITGELNWARKAEWKAELAFDDYMANSGLGNRIKSAGNVFGSGSAGYQQLGMGYRSALPSPMHWQMNGNIGSSAKTFGADEIANQEMIDALNWYNSEVASRGESVHFINAYYEQTMAIAARSNARVAAKIKTIGIDFDPNLKQGYWGYSIDRKGRPTYPRRWINTAPTPDQQIRMDIQAGPEVSLPSANRLQAISESFAVNGNFSDFNNTAITNDAMDSLGITEQKVFDIRFESTRGDRELENRMRHIEQQAASSSGTSPL
tara:strand:+ start:2392 stop:5217 length:2826 start_codon:yes stop_codon:yes gene_type:complete